MTFAPLHYEFSHFLVWLGRRLYVAGRRGLAGHGVTWALKDDSLRQFLEEEGRAK